MQLRYNETHIYINSYIVAVWLLISCIIISNNSKKHVNKRNKEPKEKVFRLS